MAQDRTIRTGDRRAQDYVHESKCANAPAVCADLALTCAEVNMSVSESAVGNQSGPSPNG